MGFSWPKPRDSLAGHLGGEAVMEGTRVDDAYMDFSWLRPRDSLGGPLVEELMMT